MLHRLLTALLAAGITSALAVALLWAIDGNLTSAQEDQPQQDRPQYERKNCPPDFHWERMSGTCCVQDYETIPSHGKINYDGASICEDGYEAETEHRPTKDGKAPPGCPKNYTSFAFLKACRPIDGGAAAPAGGTTSTGGAPGNRVQEAIRDASEALYDGGAGPSRKDLALAGAVMGGIGLLAGMTTFALGAPPITQIPRAVPGERPPPDVTQKLSELDAKIANLKQLRDQLEQLTQMIASATDSTRDDIVSMLNNVLGTITSILGVVNPAELVYTGVSLGSGLVSMWTDVTAMTREEVLESLDDMLIRISHHQGVAAAELEHLQAQRRALLNPPAEEPPGHPGAPEAPLESLTAEELSAQIAEARNQVNRALDAFHACDLELVDLHRRDCDLEIQLGEMRRLLDALEMSVGWDVAGKSAPPVGMLLTLAALVPGALPVAAGAGAVAASGTSFVSWWQRASLEQRRRLLRDAMRPVEFLRGRISTQIPMIEGRCTELRQKLADARNLLARLRGEQGRRQFYD